MIEDVIRCGMSRDVTDCWGWWVLSITLCEMSPSKKNAMTTCWDGTSRKAWLQLTFSHLSVCMCMCCSYRIIPCLKKRNNNIKHGESMSILAPLLQTANKLTSTWSTTFIYPPFIMAMAIFHILVPAPAVPASLMPPLLGATAGVFPTMPESGTTVVEQLLEVQKKSAPSRSVQRTQVLGSPNDLKRAAKMGIPMYTAIPCKQCVIYIYIPGASNVYSFEAFPTRPSNFSSDLKF